MEDEEFREFIKNLVIKHIEENTYSELMNLLRNQEIYPSLELCFKKSFSWPDFMKPYVQDLCAEAVKLRLGDITSDKVEELYDKYEYFCDICGTLNLLASYGYLRGKVCIELKKLV